MMHRWSGKLKVSEIYCFTTMIDSIDMREDSMANSARTLPRQGPGLRNSKCQSMLPLADWILPRIKSEGRKVSVCCGVCNRCQQSSTELGPLSQIHIAQRSLDAALPSSVPSSTLDRTSAAWRATSPYTTLPSAEMWYSHFGSLASGFRRLFSRPHRPYSGPCLDRTSSWDKVSTARSTREKHHSDKTTATQ
jgi:hypothetical protein